MQIANIIPKELDGVDALMDSCTFLLKIARQIITSTNAINENIEKVNQMHTLQSPITMYVPSLHLKNPKSGWRVWTLESLINEKSSVKD